MGRVQCGGHQRGPGAVQQGVGGPPGPEQDGGEERERPHAGPLPGPAGQPRLCLPGGHTAVQVREGDQDGDGGLAFSEFRNLLQEDFQPSNAGEGQSNILTGATALAVLQCASLGGGALPTGPRGRPAAMVVSAPVVSGSAHSSPAAGQGGTTGWGTMVMSMMMMMKMMMKMKMKKHQKMILMFKTFGGFKNDCLQTFTWVWMGLDCIAKASLSLPWSWSAQMAVKYFLLANMTNFIDRALRIYSVLF